MNDPVQNTTISAAVDSVKTRLLKNTAAGQNIHNVDVIIATSDLQVIFRAIKKSAGAVKQLITTIVHRATSTLAPNIASDGRSSMVISGGR
jgi:type II secretory pathway component PulL